MEIEAYLKQAIERKASDVHLVSGAQPALRIDTELVKLDEPKIESIELEKAVSELLGEQAFAAFAQTKDKDISRQVLDFNFRINLHYQRGQLVLNARLIPFVVPTPEQVDFSEVLYNLTRLRDGLVLITGPSGAGKSTTLATMIDIMNHERRSHIITIEDPIEYVFTDAQSIVEQREIGQDTMGFAVALRSALRQDPNIIMVGEMRDLETINAALTAAETGHLVLSTLHTMSAADSISRVIDAFPAHQQNQVLTQLSLSLRGGGGATNFPPHGRRFMRGARNFGQ